MRKKPNSMEREMYAEIRRQAQADARRREAEAREAAGAADVSRVVPCPPGRAEETSAGPPPSPGSR